MLKNLVRTCIGTFLPAVAFAGPITFVFDYSGETAGAGFYDPVLGAARQTALSQVGALYSDLFGASFTNTATITVGVSSYIDPASSVLASASSRFMESPGFGTGEVVRNKLISNNSVDLNGSVTDAGLFVNWAFLYQLDPSTPADAGIDQYDFTAVLFHEFTHALGIGSEMYGLVPTDRFGNGMGSAGTWSKWDQYLTDCQGGRVINPATLEIDMPTLTAARTKGCFDGANGVAAYGALLPLYANVDLSHLDEALLPTSMMGPEAAPGPEIRSWLPLEVGVLKDLGYAAVPEPASYALLLTGLGLMTTVLRRAR